MLGVRKSNDSGEKLTTPEFFVLEGREFAVLSYEDIHGKFSIS